MSWHFELIAGPYDGPAGGLAWDGTAMLFSLIDEGRILRFHPAGGGITEFRRYTNRVNGIAFDSDGALYGCQEAGRRIVRCETDGSMRPTANRLDGAFHNHPCDLAVDSAGRVWFSDPYHAKAAPGPRFFPPLHHASVLRLERDEKRAWTLTRVTYDTAAPRAVLLSPDEHTLYVAEGDAGRKGPRELRSYPIRADGSVGDYSVLHAFGADHRGEQRGIEGLCLDNEGNVIACGGSSRNGAGPLLYVFSPLGRVLETHPFPDDLPARCAFGDDDFRSLYVTTLGGRVYRARGITRAGWRRATSRQ